MYHAVVTFHVTEGCYFCLDIAGVRTLLLILSSRIKIVLLVMVISLLAGNKIYLIPLAIKDRFSINITAPFNNMRTLKFEAQPTNDCRQSNVRRLLPASGYCRDLFRYLNIAQRFDYRTLESSRKLGGVAEHLIDGSEKHICRLSFECKSPHVIEKRSNISYRRAMKTMLA